MKRTEGVVDADASFIKGTAEVTYDPQRVTPSQLVRAINGRTFYRASLSSASVRKLILKIEGMKDPDAATQVATALNKLEGIEGGTLDIEKEEAQLDFDSKKLTIAKILAAVESGTRFKVSVQSVSPEPPRADRPETPLGEEVSWFGKVWRIIASIF